MVTAMDIAKYFLALDKEHSCFNKKLVVRNGRKLYEGNARLNKYIHLANNLYFAKTGKPLCNDDFYAYDNGSVTIPVQTNYGWLLDGKWDMPNLSAGITKFLDMIYEIFEDATLDELIQIDHEDPAWIEKKDGYTKNEQKMNYISHLNDYRKMYGDMLKLMERNFS